MEDWSETSFEIGELKVKAPIVQGGMGIGISLGSLAAAVSNEGGVGVISAAGIGILRGCEPGKTTEANCRELKREIEDTRRKTNGILGVNIMVALSGFNELARTAVETGIDIIFAGAGLPLSLPECLKLGGRTKLVPIVSSAKAAGIISKWWREKFGYTPDAFVVEGPMAGGHLGFRPEQIDDPAFRLERLIPETLAVTRDLEAKTGKKIPVVAAGGIFTGKDILRFLRLGASAVQMATRFVATEECDAHPNFKKAYVDCREEDIQIIGSPVGLPGRAIGNEFLKRIAGEEKSSHPCRHHCISSCSREQGSYCISAALVNACQERLSEGFAFIGANGYKISEITTVPRLMSELCSQYREALQMEKQEPSEAFCTP